MNYVTPVMEFINLEILDVICSSGLVDGSGDDYHEPGGEGGGSTSTDELW